MSREQCSSRNKHAPNNFKYLLTSFPLCLIDVLVSGMEMFCDKNGNLFNYVQKKLDALESHTHKTWRSIGRELKVNADTLNLIEADRRSPTACLLETLKTSGKEPTMREFVQALKNCGRNDIAKYICNRPWASTEH